jgi:hypothetical protein
MNLQRFAAQLLSLLGPTTVLAALMYYFGWVRTRAFYAYFGVDVDSLGLSTSDYTLRSAEVLWPTALGILGLSILFVVAHGRVEQWASSVDLRILRRRLVLPLLGAGGVLVAVTLVLLAKPGKFAITAPLTFTTSIAFIAYARIVGRGTLAATAPKAGAGRGAGPPSTRQLESLLLGLLLLIALFWGAARLAEALGSGRARLLETNKFDTIPDVILYTSQRLHSDSSTIQERDLGPTYARFRYRYDGYKILVRSQSAMLLIPFDWSTRNAFADLVRDDGSVRLVFSPSF